MLCQIFIFAERIINNMINVTIDDKVLQQAAEKGMDAFVGTFVNAILDAIGGSLNADNMSELNSDQITLLAWHYMHEEMMDGGMIQLIHNGLGSFIWLNPTDKAFRNWGIHDLFKLINKSHYFYKQYHEDIERECSDEEFMSLFEKYPEFDDFDDEFVEHEEEWTNLIAVYIDDHIENFATINE